MRYIAILLFITASITIQAQDDRQLIREGNRLFRHKDYAKAEISYRKAIAKNPENSQAIYNLGNALLMQQKDSAAVVQFEKASKLEKNKIRLAKVYHNIGVVCQAHQMYSEAISAYQQSLRNNPNDDQTRYNLALCKRKNKDNQNKDQKKQQQKQNQNKDQQKQEQKKDQQPQNQDRKMSKENAEQLINAAIQNEKATQQRIKKAMQKPKKRTLEKNW